MPKPKTATGLDVFNALQKRLNVQGHFPSEGELLTLTIDVMNVANTDNASVVAHAASEIAANPVRVFLRGV
jgi:hypothetical protein